MGNEIDLIAGLGNPGSRYLTTRHNAGFWFADLLARRYGGEFRAEKRFHGETCDIEIAGHRVRLLKPSTYMNDSGRAVGAMSRYYQIEPARLLVAYDELDLEPGRAKLRFDGGAAGHNGISSIIEAIGSKFWRLRLGIGHPGPGQRDAVLGHVLARASSEDETAILAAIDVAIDVLPVLLQEGDQRAVNALHSRAGKRSVPSDTKES